MTVDSSKTKETYQGNGVTTIFPVPFHYSESETITLLYTDAKGKETIITSNYKITSNSSGDTSVMYPIEGEPIEQGTKLTVYRSTPLTQIVSLIEGGAFNPKVLENHGFDRIVMMIQEIQEELDRAVTFSISVDRDPKELINELFEKVEAPIKNADKVAESAEKAYLSAQKSIEASITAVDTVEDAKSLLFQQKQYGILPWDSITGYQKDALCLGSDGIIYQAIKVSGGDFEEPQPTSNSKYWIDYVRKAGAYQLGEFYYFRHPKLKEGFEPAQGGIIQRANALYPEAWEYFQTEEGKQVCVTENEWQAMTKDVWATLADDTEVGFNGIGGAPFYVQDLGAGTLRLPDIRGMYAEASGFDGLGVGGWHGDMSRKVEANAKYFRSGYGLICSNGTVTGAFYKGTTRSLSVDWHNSNESYPLQFDSSRVVPTGNANKPRAWGANACVYLGKPNINS